MSPAPVRCQLHLWVLFTVAPSARDRERPSPTTSVETSSCMSWSHTARKWNWDGVAVGEERGGKQWILLKRKVLGNVLKSHLCLLFMKNYISQGQSENISQ